jgi:hypothetical protein
VRESPADPLLAAAGLAAPRRGRPGRAEREKAATRAGGAGRRRGGRSPGTLAGRVGRAGPGRPRSGGEAAPRAGGAGRRRGGCGRGTWAGRAGPGACSTRAVRAAEPPGPRQLCGGPALRRPAVAGGVSGRPPSGHTPPAGGGRRGGASHRRRCREEQSAGHKGGVAGRSGGGVTAKNGGGAGRGPPCVECGGGGWRHGRAAGRPCPVHLAVRLAVERGGGARSGHSGGRTRVGLKASTKADCEHQQILCNHASRWVLLGSSRVSDGVGCTNSPARVDRNA